MTVIEFSLHIVDMNQTVSRPKHSFHILHRFRSQPLRSHDQEHFSLFFFFFTFLPPSLPSPPYLNSMVKHYKAFDSYYCCVTVTLFWQIQRSLSSQLLSVFFFFFLSLILVLRQEHSSGVEGSQPVRGNLCCMGKNSPGIIPHLQRRGSGTRQGKIGRQIEEKLILI